MFHLYFRNGCKTCGIFESSNHFIAIFCQSSTQVLSAQKPVKTFWVFNAYLTFMYLKIFFKDQLLYRLELSFAFHFFFFFSNEVFPFFSMFWMAPLLFFDVPQVMRSSILPPCLKIQECNAKSRKVYIKF